jgi:hypothetical protein
MGRDADSSLKPSNTHDGAPPLFITQTAMQGRRLDFQDGNPIVQRLVMIREGAEQSSSLTIHARLKNEQKSIFITTFLGESNFNSDPENPFQRHLIALHMDNV